MGIKVHLLTGGYKRFRQQVLAVLDAFAGHRLLVLNGRTGSGKSDVVCELAAEGLGVVDFEGIARHRGSAFGGIAQRSAPPSQQDFEHELAEAYLRVRHHPVLLVEVEDVLGPVSLSSALRTAIGAAPMVYLSRDFQERVERVVATYVATGTSRQNSGF